MATNDDMLDGDDLSSRPAAKAATPKKSPMKLILIGVVVIAVVGVGVFLGAQKMLGGDDAESAARSKPPPMPTVVPIEPIVVNISGTRMTRVLRMQVHLVISDPGLENVLKEMNPMVKDRIMATAGRRTLDELEGVDDRESLKRDIALEINALVRSRMAGSVLDVAFSEFLIQ